MNICSGTHKYEFVDVTTNKYLMTSTLCAWGGQEDIMEDFTKKNLLPLIKGRHGSKKEHMF